ncbi:hypothetical protein C5Y93_22245 [Blastopirellula marina]|uniref:Uncharacterized protein n=1 Tax=Blastopirellula marina TaxID=124 RepID=A0A2S8GHG8_9BACT|nr:hypothetical protein C5Y93_22245 [Blastopirellula marina]
MGPIIAQVFHFGLVGLEALQKTESGARLQVRSLTNAPTLDADPHSTTNPCALSRVKLLSPQGRPNA